MKFFALAALSPLGMIGANAHLDCGLLTLYGQDSCDINIYQGCYWCKALNICLSLCEDPDPSCSPPSCEESFENENPCNTAHCRDCQWSNEENKCIDFGPNPTVPTTPPATSHLDCGLLTLYGQDSCDINIYQGCYWCKALNICLSLCEDLDPSCSPPSCEESFENENPCNAAHCRDCQWSNEENKCVDFGPNPTVPTTPPATTTTAPSTTTFNTITTLSTTFHSGSVPSTTTASTTTTATNATTNATTSTCPCWTMEQLEGYFSLVLEQHSCSYSDDHAYYYAYRFAGIERHFIGIEAWVFGTNDYRCLFTDYLTGTYEYNKLTEPEFQKCMSDVRTVIEEIGL